MSEETCVRCGELGHDRRTLWMACFYAMHELDVPFEQCAIRGTFMKQVGEKTTSYFVAKIPVFEAAQGAEERQYPFYTLRVCKDCRGEWMAAVEAWFRSPPDRPESCGSGIFVRRHGRNVEITREEWDQAHLDSTYGRIAPISDDPCGQSEPP